MKTKYLLIAIIAVLLGAVGLLTYKVVEKNDRTPVSDAVSGDRKPYSPDVDMDMGMGLGPGDGLGNNGPNRDNRKYDNGPTRTRQNCLSDGCLAIEGLNYPAGDLTSDAKNALEKALDDEYKAYATYEAIISKLGSTRPFIMIIRAEEQHISSLKSLFDKYGLTVPENPYIGKVSAPETLESACAEGVKAETENASLYKDELLPMVKDYEDITFVFNNLMNASQQKHLVAFQRCAN